MPINVNDPEYVQAEKNYHEAGSIEDQLIAVNKMISHAPSHKGAENLRQQLTTRRKRLENQLEKKKRAGKSTQKGIKKEDMQAVILGKTNSGKSSLLKALTNASPRISQNKFTTNAPVVGMMPYKGTQIQLIENPAVEGEHLDKSLLHSADTIIILIKNLEEIGEIKKFLTKAPGKKIIVFNKIDSLTEKEKRKISATLQSKKYDFILISSIPELPNNNLEELKRKIFKSFNILRVFTKEPGKEKEKRPMIMKPHSTVKHVAEKILKGLGKKVKETKIWGPSSKFGGQKVGLDHKLKDMDVVEFKTK